MSMYKKFLIIAVLVMAFVPRAGARADTVGDQHNFSISTQYDVRGRGAIQATLQYSSDHANFYIENEFWNNVSFAMQGQILDVTRALAREFDARIYPQETAFFGSEPNPGIDKDPKITIVLTPLVDYAGGYFDTVNEDPKTITPASNEREMVYVNISTLFDTRHVDSFLAHEFQHMITYNQKELLNHVDDDVWLNELRSEYAIELLGYNDSFYGSNLERRLQSYQDDPGDSLTEWKNVPIDYGEAVLFGEFVADRFSPRVWADTLKGTAISIPAINQALTNNGFKETFTDVFSDWLIASYINDPSLGSKYYYTHANLQNLHVTPTKNLAGLDDTSVYVLTDTIKDWESRWYDLNNFVPGKNSTLKFDFVSPSLTSFAVPYVVFHNDGTKTIKTFYPKDLANSLSVNGIGSDVSRVVVMPFKKDKISGFTGDEPNVRLTFTAERVALASASTSPLPVPTTSNTAIIATPTPSPSATPSATPMAHTLPKPADYGLHEGDFIRARGDNDIYIINDFGYKRLVLSPKICLQYGHLGARGCFGAVKEVTAEVRDAFQTSWYFTNGETHDARIYQLDQTGEDDATLHLVYNSSDLLTQASHDPHSVFIINTREQNSYALGK